MLPWNCMKVKTPGHVTEAKCDVLEVCGPAISPVLNNRIAVQHSLHPWNSQANQEKGKTIVDFGDVALIPTRSPSVWRLHSHLTLLKRVDR